MSENSATQSGDKNMPPMLTGQLKVQSVANSAAAAEQALFSGLSTSAPGGKVWVTIGVTGFDVYVIFKAATGAAAVTTSTGWPVGAGQERSWLVDSTRLAYFEHIATGVGRVYWAISSPEFDNPRGYVAA